jgi:hypothetical protein
VADDHAGELPAAARRYRSKPVLKHCRLCDQPAEYRCSWGSQQFTGPHMVVIDPAGAYGVDLEVFFATHEPVPERRDVYVKISRVRAWLVTERLVLTTIVDGRPEMVADVPAGAYVVENPAGERYAMTAAAFEQRYEPDE